MLAQMFAFVTDQLLLSQAADNLHCSKYRITRKAQVPDGTDAPPAAHLSDKCHNRPRYFLLSAGNNTKQRVSRA